MPLADAPHQIGDDSERLPAWQPWAALAAASLGLNFVWEMLQAPLYQGMLTMPLSGAIRLCVQASAGDAVITLAAYGGVAFAVRSRVWMTHPHVGRIAAYLATGLAVTIALEYLNVYGLGRWSYSAAMPRVLGVGLAPLAQWIIVPIVILWFVRRYLRRELSHTSLF